MPNFTKNYMFDNFQTGRGVKFERGILKIQFQICIRKYINFAIEED